MTKTFGPSADFPPKKRSGTRAIRNGGQLFSVCMAKTGQFHAKCNHTQYTFGFDANFLKRGHTERSENLHFYQLSRMNINSQAV